MLHILTFLALREPVGILLFETTQNISPHEEEAEEEDSLLKHD
jgi:hypothetical protein